MVHHPERDFLFYRASPTEIDCIEGWTGSEWIPDCYVANLEDVAVHLVLNRNEGATVELTDTTIAHALHILRCKAKSISYKITLLEQALDGNRTLDRKASSEDP